MFILDGDIDNEEFYIWLTYDPFDPVSGKWEVYDNEKEFNIRLEKLKKKQYGLSFQGKIDEVEEYVKLLEYGDFCILDGYDDDFYELDGYEFDGYMGIL